MGERREDGSPIPGNHLAAASLVLSMGSGVSVCVKCPAEFGRRFARCMERSQRWVVSAKGRERETLGVLHIGRRDRRDVRAECA